MLDTCTGASIDPLLRIIDAEREGPLTRVIAPAHEMTNTWASDLPTLRTVMAAGSICRTTGTGETGR